MSRVTLKATSAAFEVLVVRIVVGLNVFSSSTYIPLPPGGDVVAFLDELSDLDDEMTVAGGHPVLIDDFNTPGKSCQSDTRLRSSDRVPYNYNYRDFRRMDTAAFAAYLRKTDSLTRPSLDVDEAVRQLDVDITFGLEGFAAVRTKTRRLGRHSNAWLPTKPRESDDDWKDTTLELDRQQTN